MPSGNDSEVSILTSFLSLDVWDMVNPHFRHFYYTNYRQKLSRTWLIHREGDPLSNCIASQTAFWKEIVAMQQPLSSDIVFFPCERLVGSGKKVALFDFYSTNETLRNAIQDILNAMPQTSANSNFWLNFDLGLAIALSGEAFPFPNSTGFGAVWKNYYEFYKSGGLSQKNALTLSAMAVHGSTCRTVYSVAALQAFGSSYLEARNATAQQQALTSLRKTCP